MGETGYVYILRNEAMPGIYKIGITGRDKLEDRINELYKTNIPLPFECEFAAVVEDYEKVEGIIHNASIRTGSFSKLTRRESNPY